MEYIALILVLLIVLHTAWPWAVNIYVINSCQAAVDAMRAETILDQIESGETETLFNLIDLPYLESITDFKYWWRALDDFELMAQDMIMRASMEHMEVPEALVQDMWAVVEKPLSENTN